MSFSTTSFQPVAAIACSTLNLVASRTRPAPETTRETVAIDTPAQLATSTIVGSRPRPRLLPPAESAISTSICSETEPSPCSPHCRPARRAPAHGARAGADGPVRDLASRNFTLTAPTKITAHTASRRPGQARPACPGLVLRRAGYPDPAVAILTEIQSRRSEER